jgi:hypothetical protein
MATKKDTAGMKSDEAAEVLDKEESVVDEKLVDQAVVWIREKVQDTVNRGMAEIGDYVLKTFFGGQPEKVSSRDPYKNASFRKLAERCDTDELPIGKSWLHNAVGVAVLRKSLPAGSKAFQQLTPSHQVALLPVHEPDKVVRLAERAVSKRLSVKDLKAIVKEQLDRVEKEPSGRGRPPMPVVLKWLARSERGLALKDRRRLITKTHVGELSADEKEDALKKANGLIEDLRGLIKLLREHRPAG